MGLVLAHLVDKRLYLFIYHHHGSLDWTVSWTTACSRIQVACILILKNVPDLTQMFLGH